MSLDKSRKRRSLKEHKDSQKLIEKQANAFRLFRATNAFLMKSDTPKPGLLYDTGTPSQGTTVTDSLPDSLEGDDTSHNEQIQKLRSFVNYANEKFSFVQTNQSPDGSFITNDDYYLNNVPVMADISATIHEDISLAAQFQFRSKLYQILVDDRQIFSTFKKMLEIHFLRGWLDPEPDKDDRYTIQLLCAMIEVFLVNGTDCHPGFGEAFCNEPGLLEILVCFIREKKNATKENTRDDELTWQTLTLAIQTLYNCSMNDANRSRLRETAALEASLPFVDSDDRNMGLVGLLTVAYLADEKQSEKFMAKKKGPVEYLVRRMEEAVRSDDKRDSEAWVATELIKGLGRLALNDANKSLIAECGAIPVLITQARQDDTPSEQLDSMEVLWTLTFDQELQKTDIFNEGLELFNRLAGTADNHVCTEAAKGILWNLRSMPGPVVSEYTVEDSRHDHDSLAGSTCVGNFQFGRAQPTSAAKIADDHDAQESAPYIMISYQWDSQELILKIKAALESQGYKVWIDLEKMAGSILEAMAAAVEGACLVLICCSKKYKDSQNCRAEAEYTFKRKTEFIPLIVEKRYDPDGWLGIMLGTKMYYNFTRVEGFEDKMKELTRALGNKGKISPVTKKDPDPVPFPQIVPEKATFAHMSPPKPSPRGKSVTPATESVPPPSHGQTTAEPLPVKPLVTNETSRERQSASDVKNWDADRVRIWMEQYNMDKGKLGQLTGPHLHFLRRMKEDAPSVYYKWIKENFHLTDIDQMAALTNALEEL